MVHQSVLQKKNWHVSRLRLKEEQELSAIRLWIQVIKIEDYIPLESDLVGYHTLYLLQ